MDDTPMYETDAHERYSQVQQLSDQNIEQELNELLQSKSKNEVAEWIPIAFCFLVAVYWIMLWYKYRMINTAINKLDIQQFRISLNDMRIYGSLMPLLYIITLGLCYSPIGKQHVVFSQVMMWLTILMVGFGIGIWWISSKIIKDCVDEICDYSEAKYINNYLFTLLGCGSIANFMAIVYFYFFNEMMKQQVSSYFHYFSNFIYNYGNMRRS